MTRCHWSCSHLGWAPCAGAQVVAWLGRGSVVSALGNWSCWAQGHLELAQGLPLCHSVESKETDPFLHFLAEGRSLVQLEEGRLGF